MPFYLQIAAALLKMITRHCQRPNQADHEWNNVLIHWTRCLDRMMTINSFLLEMHEMASNQPVEDGEPLPLFPPHPDLRKDPKVEKLSLRIAALDFAPLYGRGRGFHIDDPDIRGFTGAIVFGLVMAADLYVASNMTDRAQRVMSTGFGLKYLTNPDFLAARVGEAAKELPVEFVQRFYGMSEGQLGRPLRRTMGKCLSR